MSSRRQSDRAFGFMFAMIFAAITGFVSFSTGGVNLVLLATSATFAAAAWVWPMLLLPLNRLWQKFARGLGFVTNHLILGIMLYVVITPVGLVMRMFGRNPMIAKIEPQADTYFTAVHRHATQTTFPDMF